MSNEIADFNIPLDLSGDDIGTWDGVYQLVPAGRYRAEIVKVEQATSKSSGGAVLRVQFQIVEEGPEQGKKLTKSYSLKQDANVLSRVKNLLVAAGASLHSINSAELMGAQLSIEVVVRDGKAGTDAMGNPIAAKPQNDIQGEMPVENAAPAQTAAPRGKPVGAAKPQNGAAARR